MALPITGLLSASQINVELGRAVSATFQVGGASERNLAKVPTGSLSFGIFRGKSSVILRTITSSVVPVTLESLFDPADWTSSTDKMAILPSGSFVGTTNPALSAITVGSAWGGGLTLEIGGIVYGASGVANSGVGGTAINANTAGDSAQLLQVSILASGSVLGGGGGGGLGGQGGTGYYDATAREPASGQYFTEGDPATGVNGYNNQWFWGNTYVGATTGSTLAAGGYTYYKGTHVTDRYYGSDGGSPYPQYGIYRTNPYQVWVNGAAGGAGGRGDGFDGVSGLLARASGTAGGNAGGNSGVGGTGGIGGTWGISGATGATGASGNWAAGAGGAAGGASGFAIQNSGNASYTNAGTLLGRIG